MIQHKQAVHREALGQTVAVPDLTLPGLGKITQNVKSVLTSRVVKISLIDSGSIHK